MSEMIRVNETTHEKLEKLKEREDLDTFDSVIRVLLERMSPKKKDSRELEALGDASKRFLEKNVDLDKIEVEEV